MTKKQVVENINKMFPPADTRYPVCFERDGMVIVSGECGAVGNYKGEKYELRVIDYYGEFRGGHPWVHKKLLAYAKKLGRYWEWENAACIVLAGDELED